MSYFCKYCHKEFHTSAAIAGHTSHCKLNPNKKRSKEGFIEANKKGRETYINNHPEIYVEKDFDCICSVCGNHYTVHISQNRYNKGDYRKTCSSKCSNSHIHTEEWKKHISEGVKNSEKFQKNYKDKRKYYNICRQCGNKFERPRMKNGRLSYTDFCSKECISKFLSENSKNKGCGGYISNKTYGKGGKYKGIRCDSSWELAFLVYYLDHGKHIERCHEIRKYNLDGKELKYFPDFVTDEGIIEIKGREDKRSIAKHEQHPDIITYRYDDIKPMIQYTKNMYGTRFWEKLYDKKDKSRECCKTVTCTSSKCSLMEPDGGK